MNGEEIDLRILKLLALYPSVIGFHIPDSRRMKSRGFPDWVFFGENGILWREVKGSDDTLTVEQRHIGRLIVQADGDWQVWGPRDLIPNGRAESQIREIA